jgi:hypothetical protein
LGTGSLRLDRLPARQPCNGFARRKYPGKDPGIARLPGAFQHGVNENKGFVKLLLIHNICGQNPNKFFAAMVACDKILRNKRPRGPTIMIRVL